MSERFELGDDASGLAFGVAAAEVVAAEVAVKLAGGERVPRAGPDKRVLALVHDNARYVKLTGASSYRLFPATAAAAQVVCPLFTLASSR